MVKRWRTDNTMGSQKCRFTYTPLLRT
jgi:hypothetical protein